MPDNIKNIIPTIAIHIIPFLVISGHSLLVSLVEVENDIEEKVEDVLRFLRVPFATFKPAPRKEPTMDSPLL